MKAVYTTTADGRVYRVNQPTNIPSVLLNQFFGATASEIIDAPARTVTQSVAISTLHAEGEKSNRELYLELLAYIKEHKITEIDTIQNDFRIYIEYETFDGKRSLGVNSVSAFIEPIESIVPLGTATNSENVYRQVKNMKTKAEFVIKNTVPYGVMGNPKHDYTIHITDIAVFQNFSSIGKPFNDIHMSTYNTPYGINQYSAKENVENMTIIYSTASEGIVFKPLKLKFIPRSVFLDLELVLSDYVIAYDTYEIDKIIQENIRDKYHIDPSDPVIPEHDVYPKHMIIGDNGRPAADGSVRPDKDGHYDYYERCTQSNPDALLVVEDDFPDAEFDEDVMIRKKDVILDIRDIQIGDYVHYVEGFISQYHKEHHHHHRPCPPCPCDSENEESGEDVNNYDGVNGEDSDTNGSFGSFEDDDEIQIDASEVM